MLNRQAIVDEIEECLRLLADKAGDIPTRMWSDQRCSLGEWAKRNGEKKPLPALAKLILLLEPGTTITFGDDSEVSFALFRDRGSDGRVETARLGGRWSLRD